MARNSAWRSEAEDSLNCSRQLAIGFWRSDRNDIHTSAIPIPQIFPTQDTAMNVHLPTRLAEIRPATRNQKGFLRDCGEAKTGFSSASPRLQPQPELQSL